MPVLAALARPYDVPLLPAVYTLFHLPGPVSKVAGQTISVFKVPCPPGPPAAVWPCAFPSGRLYDSIGLNDCQRFKRYFFGLTVHSAFCTNSPALFCAFCTPCPHGQTPPALINQSRPALSRVSVAVARFLGCGGILYYLTVECRGGRFMRLYEGMA